jgi:tetratricopeptide (TPR) repeat protein
LKAAGELPAAPPLEAGAPGPASPGESEPGRAACHVLLAGARASEGDGADLEAELDLALAAGATPEQFSAVLGLLDPEAGRLLLEALAKRLPRPGFSSASAASWFAEADLDEGSFRLLAAAIEEPGADIPGLAGRLVEADPEAAAALLLRLSAERDFDPQLLMVIADALEEEERPDLARPFLDRVLAVDPGSFRAIDVLSRMDPRAALAAAEAGVRHAPENASLWGKLGELRRTGGDRRGAFEAYRQAALLASDEDDRRTWLVGMAGADPLAALPLIRRYAADGDDETMGVLGRTLSVVGESAEAFEVFLAAHRKDLSDAEWLHRLVALDPARAESILQEEMDRPDAEVNDEVVGAYAQAVLRDGRPDAAFDAFLRAHEMDREDWEWLRGLARSNPARAAPLLEALRDEMPESANVLGALGDAWAGLGRQAEAADLFVQAIESDDSPARWMAALAAVEPGRGLPMLLSAVEAKSGDDEYWGALGDAYRSLGRIEEAREAYDKALTLDPDDWEWNMNREQIR